MPLTSQTTLSYFHRWCGHFRHFLCIIAVGIKVVVALVVVVVVAFVIVVVVVIYVVVVVVVVVVVASARRRGRELRSNVG